MEVNQGILIDIGETREITIRYIPYITGDVVVTTVFSVDGGENIEHEYSFKVDGPNVSIANINSLVVDVKPHSGKKFPITLKNNSDVDAEVLLLYKD